MRRFALVADLGGTKIAAARVDDTGRITHRLRAPTPPAGGTAVVEAIARLLGQLPAKDACAVGVDVPGLAHPSGVVWAPNIPGWEQMPLARMLAERMQLRVVVESDRNAFVTGEAWKGAAKGCRDVVFLMIGTGIGAGIVSGGRLIRGHGELSGCTGWMAVCDRYRGGYESVGCLEFHAAGPGIARAAGRLFSEPVTAREVVKLARAGDARAQRVLAGAGHYLGLALANLVDILNPEIIVIGGGVAAAGNLLFDPARRTMLQWAQPLAVKQVRIAPSRLGERAGVLGAARLCFDQFQDSP
jgi:glucokinase